MGASLMLNDVSNGFIKRLNMVLFPLPASLCEAEARNNRRLYVEMMGLIGAGNNPMVGMTVACAVAIEEASK